MTITTETLLNMLHPGIIMMAAGVVVMLLPQKCSGPLNIIGSLAALGSLFYLNENSAFDYHLTSFLTIKLIAFDRLAFVFLLAFCIIAVINAVYGCQLQNKFEAGMAMIYAGSIMGITLAGDCISLIAFWEVAAFASAYVVYAGHCRRSSKAAFRYILVHSFGGNLFLVGILVHMFHYGNSIENISGQTGTAAFWLMLIGVAVNAAIPPLNAWLSDAYPEATITGTPYLASYTTKAAIYVLIRLFAGYEVLLWVGVVMAIYAACMAILENNVRKLLSYHIVSQLGMMVAAVGIGNAVGIDGATAHAITNIMFKGVLMMGAGAVVYATGKGNITELGGLGKRMPITSVCFLICSLAIAGLPGLSGFVSKALIMDAAAEEGLVAAGILLTVASVGTLLSIALKINYYVFWGPCGEEEKNLQLRPVPISMNIAMILGTIVTVAIGVCPQLFYGLMANQTIIHPYELGHVMEYIGIFIGGSIPFFIFLNKMKPHDEYTLDFDWFYRKPLNSAVQVVSKVIYAFFDYFGELSVKIARYLGVHAENPYLYIRNSQNPTIRKMSFENEDHPVGDTISVVLFVVACIMVAAVALFN